MEQPVFIGYGEKDEQDNVPVEESVRRVHFIFARAGKTNHQIVVAPGVGHALWNEKQQFAPELTKTLEAWLKRYILQRAR